MGLLGRITPFRQISRAYGALLTANHSLAVLAQRHSALGELAQHLAAVAQKLDNLTNEVERLNAPGVSLPQPPSQVQARYDFNDVLHEGRSALMREMPPNAERVVSAGCSGRLYFEWIEKTYGYIPEHIGIEYYLPKPHLLPDNVTWIANTAGNMEAIADQTCDLLISGQNIEHLWPEDVVGFLMESARVLRAGSTLCVDSPNRALTARLNWTHPEHTIELTVPEIRHLLELAGFDVTKEAGIWLCEDPKTRRLLPIDPNTPDPEWSVSERIFSAASKPEHSFLWWIESRRTERKPDREALRKFLHSIYAIAWPERIQRLVLGPSLVTERRSDGEWISVPPGYDGVVFFGPYMPLRRGRHRITFEFEPDPSATAAFARCDVAIGPEGTVIAERETMPGQTQTVLEVEIQELTFGGQFRCYATGRAAFAVRRHIYLVETLSETATSAITS
ncbi:methyltransferase domain-containing protein [Paraburkholderia nodosa]|uniref:methyltransferase domain-containing protein n=1 Tax=Paraburkholderia nodosa TaxID=392320 RepID=UPI00114CF46A|nr:class I SAM-dependent methyltransferase [Paraburkholderia nodosa]